MHLLCCQPGATDALWAELSRRLPGVVVEPVVPGLVEATAVPSRLAFCRQLLPDAERLGATSVKRWAQAIFDVLDARFGADEPPPWRLHVVALEGGEVGAGRAELIADALGALMSKHRRSWRRALGAAVGAWRGDEWVVQVVLWGARVGAVSVTGPAVRDTHAHLLVPWPGGRVDVADDKRPPSRAYRKLLEIEARYGAITPGQRCVDLGASPGGWTYVALERGAHVVAVDRSPLRADLMHHPHLTFHQGDAFRFRPDAPPVDWLLCDVIAAPQRSIELVMRWLDAGWCRQLAVTFKLKGRAGDRHLDRAIDLLTDRSDLTTWDVRHLDANQNEVTCFARTSARSQGVGGGF